MKRLLATALLGLVSLTLFVSSADAQTGITAAAGDVILGFYATSGTGAGTDLEVDLGNAELFMTAAPGQVINLSGSTGLALADLTSTYGSNWFSNPALFWGAVAGNTVTPIPGATTDSIWATDPELTPGTPSVPWTASTRFAQAQGSSTALGVVVLFNSVGTTTANSSEAILTTDSLGYFAADTSQFGLSFGYFPGNFSVDNSVTNVDANGNSISELDALFTSTGFHPAQVLGKFELNSNGNFEFIAATPVAEPSTMGLTGAGFLGLVGFVALRRQHSVLC